MHSYEMGSLCKNSVCVCVLLVYFLHVPTKSMQQKLEYELYSGRFQENPVYIYMEIVSRATAARNISIYI